MSNNTSLTNATSPASTPRQTPQNTDVQFIIEMCITWPFVLIGIIGNLLVIVIMISKKLRTRILTNNDLFLLHLASVDFLYICFNTGSFVYHLKFFSPHLKTFSYCIIFYPLLNILYTTGVFTIAAMAVYRCWVITNPFKPKLSPKLIYLCVLAIWILAGSLFIPLPITTTNKDDYCPFDESKILLKAYLPALTIVQYPLPLLVMIMSYVIIGVYVRKTKLPKTSIIARGNNIKNHREESTKESIALAKTVGVIVLLFAILMLPLQIGMEAVMIFGVSRVWPSYLWSYGDRLAMINSALNPYMYTIRTPQYRQLALRLIRPRCRSNSNGMSYEKSKRSPSSTPSCVTTEVAMNGNKDGEKFCEVQIKQIDAKI